jgi:hypothetical protein
LVKQVEWPQQLDTATLPIKEQAHGFNMAQICFNLFDTALVASGQARYFMRLAISDIGK